MYCRDSQAKTCRSKNNNKQRDCADKVRESQQEKSICRQLMRGREVRGLAASLYLRARKPYLYSNCTIGAACFRCRGPKEGQILILCCDCCRSIVNVNSVIDASSYGLGVIMARLRGSPRSSFYRLSVSRHQENFLQIRPFHDRRARMPLQTDLSCLSKRDASSSDWE